MHICMVYIIYSIYLLLVMGVNRYLRWALRKFCKVCLLPFWCPIRANHLTEHPLISIPPYFLYGLLIKSTTFLACSKHGQVFFTCCHRYLTSKRSAFCQNGTAEAPPWLIIVSRHLPDAIMSLVPGFGVLQTHQQPTMTSASTIFTPSRCAGHCGVVLGCCSTVNVP